MHQSNNPGSTPYLVEAFQAEKLAQLNRCLPGNTLLAESMSRKQDTKRGFEFKKTLLVPGSDSVRASLTCAYRVRLKPTSQKLIVEASSFSIQFRTAKRPVPIVRVEFEQDAHSKPKTHFHTHSDSVPFALLLARAGLHQQAGHQQDVHFPMGGPYFRVCLEDMIELSITELGATGLPGWQEHVARGRHQYWQNQVQSVTTEELPTVITTLESQGFTIIPPPDFDPENYAA